MTPSAAAVSGEIGFASLRDLPDLERLKAEGLLQGGQGGDDLHSALGLADEEKDVSLDEAELDSAEGM